MFCATRYQPAFAKLMSSRLDCLACSIKSTSIRPIDGNKQRQWDILLVPANLTDPKRSGFTQILAVRSGHRTSWGWNISKLERLLEKADSWNHGGLADEQMEIINRKHVEEEDLDRKSGSYFGRYTMTGTMISFV
ncbi:unnamed protein product [Absidia cylindrospora]